MAREPLRITLFADRPAVMLIAAFPTADTEMPVLEPPFTKEGIEKAFLDLKLPVRVAVTAVAPEYAAAVKRVDNQEKAIRGARQRQEEAERAFEKATTVSGPLEEQRIALIQKKQEVDEELRRLKLCKQRAAQAARRHGKYMPEDAFRDLEDQLHQRTTESIALQGELQRVREQRSALWAQDQLARLRKFKETAKEVLDPETFENIVRIAKMFSEGRERGC